MRTIAPYAEQILNENYRRFVSIWNEQHPDNQPYTIAEWCDIETQSDPNFFRWLFNDPDIDDFGNNLDDGEIKAATDFFETI